jgi:hypothetical protein
LVRSRWGRLNYACDAILGFQKVASISTYKQK